MIRGVCSVFSGLGQEHISRQGGRNAILSLINASFFFINNSDHEGPTAIHSTSLLPCSWAGGSTIGTVDDVFCWRGWSYNLHRNESQFNA